MLWFLTEIQQSQQSSCLSDNNIRHSRYEGVFRSLNGLIDGRSYWGLTQIGFVDKALGRYRAVLMGLLHGYMPSPPVYRLGCPPVTGLCDVTKSAINWQRDAGFREKFVNVPLICLSAFYPQRGELCSVFFIWWRVGCQRNGSGTPHWSARYLVDERKTTQ